MPRACSECPWAEGWGFKPMDPERLLEDLAVGRVENLYCHMSVETPGPGDMSIDPMAPITGLLCRGLAAFRGEVPDDPARPAHPDRETALRVWYRR